MQFLCFADVRCHLDWSNKSHCSSGKARFPLQNAETKTSAPTQKFSRMAKVNARVKEKTEVKEARRSNCVMATRIEATFAPLQWHLTVYLNLSSLSSFHADQAPRRVQNGPSWMERRLRTCPCQLGEVSGGCVWDERGAGQWWRETRWGLGKR